MYYQYKSSWKKFLEDLGIEVKISPKTTQEMKQEGIKHTLGEICLPVKIFVSHIIHFTKEPADYIFIPRIISVNDTCFTCPKFMGLPDMIRALNLENLPPILEIEIDLKANDQVYFKKLGLLSKTTGIDQAVIAEKVQTMYEEMIKPIRPIEYQADLAEIKIGLVGPVYILQDPKINLNLVEILKELGANVIIQGRDASRLCENLPKDLFWQPAKEIYNAAIDFLQDPEINGLIYLSAFPCGQHSMLEPIFNQLKKENQWFPFQMLNLDEHTAEAGLKTRVQTFVNLIIKKKKAGKLYHQPAKYPYYSSPLSADWLKKKSTLVSDLLRNKKGKGKKPILLPNLGVDTLALYYGFRLMGANIFPTPPSDQKTLELGTALAPETACYPLKVCIGNFAKVLKDNPKEKFILVFGGGRGPCRFGLYGTAIEACLRLRGINNFEMVCVESFSARYNRDIAQPVNFWRKLQLADSGFIKAFRYCAPGLSPLVVFENLQRANFKGTAIDRLLKKTLKIRPRELKAGSTSRAYKKGLELLDQAGKKEEIVEAKTEAFRLLEKVLIDKERIVPKVVVTGEFYTVIDPFSNNDLIEQLGELGLEVDVFPYVFDWIRSGFNKIHGLCSKEIERAAEPYLSRFIGGDGWESVGMAVLTKDRGYDGFVHIAPFSCMPETVASEIIKKVSAEFDLPVLTLLYDVQLASVGYRTRIETFAQLLHIRKGTGRARLIKRILKEAGALGA